MQIRLYNSSNNNHIALRFTTEVTSRQLVLPFMLSKPVTRIRLQIVQRIDGSESILAQEDYRHSGFRLTNLVLDGSTLKVYANGSVLCIVTVTPMTVDRLELTGGAKKWLVDEMFVAPYAATEEEIKGWYEAKKPFIDLDEINTIDQKVAGVSQAFAAHESDASAHHERYTDAEAIAAVWGAAGAGSGLDADKLRGYVPGVGANNVLKLDSAGKAALSAIPDNLTGKSADKVDSYHANTGIVANTIPVRNSSGKVPGSITGDAATVGGKAASAFLQLSGGNPTGVVNFNVSASARVVLPVGTDKWAT